MTTVAEMIAKLQTMPQDAEVECMVETTCGYSTYGTFASVDADDMKVFDYSEEQYKGTVMFGRKIVFIQGI